MAAHRTTAVCTIVGGVTPDPCGGTLRCLDQAALFQHTRLQPFLDQANDLLVANSVLESGRVEARTGLRMMPTFPRSPLSFRTAGFPQYGWKAGLSGVAFPDRQRLKPAPGMRLLTPGLPSPFV